MHSQKELQQVQEELARLQQDFNQSLLQAESEKQQVCEVVFIGLLWLFRCFLNLKIFHLFMYFRVENCLVTTTSQVLSSQLPVCVHQKP